MTEKTGKIWEMTHPERTQTREEDEETIGGKKAMGSRANKQYEDVREGKDRDGACLRGVDMAPKPGPFQNFCQGPVSPAPGRGHPLTQQRERVWKTGR